MAAAEVAPAAVDVAYNPVTVQVVVPEEPEVPEVPEEPETPRAPEAEPTGGVQPTFVG